MEVMYCLNSLMRESEIMFVFVEWIYLTVSTDNLYIFLIKRKKILYR